MTHTKTGTIAELVIDLVARGPLTGFEIARALEIRHRVPVRGREGAVYAALLQLERDGWIEGVPLEGGHRSYSLPLLRDVKTAARSGGDAS